MKAEKLGKQFHFDNEFWDEPLSCGWIDLYQLGEISCEHGFEIEEHEQFVHEVTYIISGSGEACVDGKKIPLREGDVLMCSMGHQHAIEAAEKRGVPVVALSMVPAKDFVVQNDSLDGVLCYYKAYDKTGAMGDETTVLAENTVNELDARKALAMLKLKMRKRS